MKIYDNGKISPNRLLGRCQLWWKFCGCLKGLTLDIEGLKRQFYEEGMGFDYETGAISKDKIEELGLENVLS